MKSVSAGRCLCGAIRFECTGEPVMTGNCHCRDCQRASGAAYVTAFFFPKEAVRVAGEVRFFEATADSGNTFTRGFCPACGSNLFGVSSGYEHLIGVRAATLDEPARFRPRVNIFVASAPSWHVLDESLPHFAQGAPTRR
jgi:hypothetical protein